VTPLAIVLAAVVHFTLPAFEADTTGGFTSCAAGPRACTDLDSVFVWVQPRGTLSAVLAYKASVRGQEGLQVQVVIATDSVATVWAVTQDLYGNRSCPSNLVGVNLVVSVPPATAPPKLEWFDVAGRRLAEKPTAPGVYYWRRGRERGVQVVLR
jgi:hypothetical protein